MIFASPLGPLTVKAKNGGICILSFSGQDRDTCGDGLNECASQVSEIIEPADKAALESASRWLTRYFSGTNPGPLPPLTLSGTSFQLKIWNALCSIPYGHTATYGDIARIVGCQSSQAVGQAIHNNPVAIIVPCHRVIGSDGSLTGFAAGLTIKAALLQIEGSLLL